MNVSIWGPSFWFSLHTVTFTYPFYPNEIEKNKIQLFFESIQAILPCKICRDHYAENLKQFPIQTNSRAELMQWLIQLHNSVNRNTGKREWSMEEVISKYEQIFGHPILLYPHTTELYKKQNNEYNYTILYWFLLISIFLLIVLFYKK